LAGTGPQRHQLDHTLSATDRLMSYHVFPRHLQVGDRFSDETGEWQIASRPYSTEGGQRIHTPVRRVDQPATVADRTWIAHERICVKALSGF
jgi:hypothetical protein